MYKKFEPIVRAPTPSVTAPELEEAETAVLLLQRLLRGRAMQNGERRRWRGGEGR